MATAKEALLNSRYALGVVAEVKIALWLLSSYSAGPATWLGYFLLTTSALMTIFGMVWYGRWFTQIGLRNWYIAVLTFLLGCGLIAIARNLTPHMENIYAGRPPSPWYVDTILSSGIFLTVPLLLYCAWRVARWTVIRAFKVLLVAVSQLGSAWRGELPPP